MGRIRNTGINLGIALVCVAFVILMAPVPAHIPGATVIVWMPNSDIPDPSDPGVLAANLSASLVQQGTVTPYLGEGAPGLVLQVKVPNISRALNWTLEGWANQTTTPALQVCKHGYHFSSLDWVAINSASDSKTYLTVSASPLRMTPDGDQCPAHALAFGVWEVKVRMDHLPGGPRQRYETPEGWHNDTWDRSDTWTFQVPV